MTPDEFRRRAEDARLKAQTAQAQCAKNMHLQLAEQFERRAVWAELPKR